MGYTHYDQVRNAQRIIDQDNVSLTGASADPDEVIPPIVDEVEGVYLNGVGFPGP
ncbi:hypothetical protein ASPCADRAFT_208124 [Aspergillus carbonarius ITEM 5010]|uniref:Uncharacterized protein n=1 Tax=Aspergillus carbonarius (strain ITEM 5010) TaxID=602072 RepID=A0A1R3RM90_ASPC5|nr:hypothetical protein ASPCADRAFT_208124 [Aspergillus carbonarius ITEM 5010]